MGNLRNRKVLLEGKRGRGHLRDFDTYVTTILKRALQKEDGRVWTEFIWLKLETSDWVF
jgi:hypothetical protein